MEKKRRRWNWGNIIRWGCFGCIMCCFLAYMDSAGAALFFGLAAVISAPIPVIDRYVMAKGNKSRRAFICLQLLLALALFFVGACLTPAESADDPTPPSEQGSVVDNEQEAPGTVIDDPEPTPDPEPEPTPEPTPEPDPTPEPVPTPEPTPTPEREIPHKENYHGHVYATPRGECYHYEAHCGGENSVEITWDDVDRRCLRPCQTCVLR